MKRKIFSAAAGWLLTLAVLMTAIASCDVGKNETPDATTEASGAPVLWFDVKTADAQPCGVYYPMSCSTDVIDAADLLAEYIASVCGIAVRARRESFITDDGSYKILVGATTRRESADFIAQLGYSDYGFELVDEKTLCVSGCLDSQTVQAVKQLAKLMINGLSAEKKLASGDAESGGLYLSSEQNSVTRAAYPIKSATVDSVPIEDYKIVVGSGHNTAELASQLRARIGITTGKLLEIAEASEAETANEILVGNTGRAASAEFYVKTLSENYADYEIVVGGGKVQLNGGTEAALKTACNDFFSRYFPVTGAPQTVAVDSSSSYSGVLASDDIAIASKASADSIRVMSNNVYFYNFTQKRVNFLAESYAFASPDVLLLQEVGISWHRALEPLLTELGYTAVPTNGTGDLANVKATENYTPIYYRASTFTLVDCGYDQFESVKQRPDGDLSSSKSFTWAVLEQRATGKRFAVISTHLTWYSDPTQAEKYRVADAAEVMAQVAAIEAKYAIPVIVMGDMNSSTGADAYKVFGTGNLVDVRNTSVKKVNWEYNSWHDVGVVPPLNSSIIDHVFISKSGLTAELYQMLVNEYTVAATDHVPIALDFSLK